MPVSSLPEVTRRALIDWMRLHRLGEQVSLAEPGHRIAQRIAVVFDRKAWAVLRHEFHGALHRLCLRSEFKIGRRSAADRSSRPDWDARSPRWRSAPCVS